MCVRVCVCERETGGMEGRMEHSRLTGVPNVDATPVAHAAASISNLLCARSLIMRKQGKRIKIEAQMQEMCTKGPFVEENEE